VKNRVILFRVIQGRLPIVPSPEFNLWIRYSYGTRRVAASDYTSDLLRFLIIRPESPESHADVILPRVAGRSPALPPVWLPGCSACGRNRVGKESISLFHVVISCQRKV